jgi:hypothetical protein
MLVANEMAMPSMTVAVQSHMQVQVSKSSQFGVDGDRI